MTVPIPEANPNSTAVSETKDTTRSGVGTPDPTSTAGGATTRETSNFGAASDGTGKPDGPSSSYSGTAFDTSGAGLKRATRASGAVVDTRPTGTVDTLHAGVPGPIPLEARHAYRAPLDIAAPVTSTRDTTLTDRYHTDPDYDPQALPSSYAVETKETAYIGAVADYKTFGPPAAPTNIRAEAVKGTRWAEVFWDYAGDETEDGIIRWVIESNTSGTKSAPRSERGARFHEGLVAGEGYTFTVYAETHNGTGFRSAPSNRVVISKADLRADVNYVEDDRSGYYDAEGNHHEAAPEATEGANAGYDEDTTNTIFAAAAPGQPASITIGQ